MGDLQVAIGTGGLDPKKHGCCLDLRLATISLDKKQCQSDKKPKNLHYIFESGVPQSPAAPLQNLIVPKKIAAACRRWVKGRTKAIPSRVCVIRRTTLPVDLGPHGTVELPRTRPRTTRFEPTESSNGSSSTPCVIRIPIGLNRMAPARFASPTRKDSLSCLQSSLSAKNVRKYRLSLSGRGFKQKTG